MSLVLNISSLVSRIATEFRSIRTMISGSNTGDVSGLQTEATNIVAAINEVNAKPTGAQIDDNPNTMGGWSTSTVWSSYKANAEIQAAVNNLINGAPGALDTLQELAAALGNDGNFASSVTNSLAAKADTTYVDGQLSGKANVADVYTWSEVDGLLAAKANSADVYTQTQVDSYLSAKADVTYVDGVVGNLASVTYVDSSIADVEANLGANYNNYSFVTDFESALAA